MEEFVGGKISAWRSVDHWLMPGFLLAGRSGPDTPDRKSSLEIFFGNRGGLMATKDSGDEGGLVKVRYNH